MNEYNIPMIAYIFVGVTSFVLAYATYSESNDEQSSELESTPLPDVFPSNNYQEEEEDMVVEESEQEPEPEPEQPQNLPVVGGKSKKTKSKKTKSKKSKSKKSKTKKNRTKHTHHKK
jgi:hypothetical protein